MLLLLCWLMCDSESKLHTVWELYVCVFEIVVNELPSIFTLYKRLATLIFMRMFRIFRKQFKFLVFKVFCLNYFSIVWFFIRIFPYSIRIEFVFSAIFVHQNSESNDQIEWFIIALGTNTFFKKMKLPRTYN